MITILMLHFNSKSNCQHFQHFKFTIELKLSEHEVALTSGWSEVYCGMFWHSKLNQFGRFLFKPFFENENTKQVNQLKITRNKMFIFLPFITLLLRIKFQTYPRPDLGNIRPPRALMFFLRKLFMFSKKIFCLEHAKFQILKKMTS
jgi:hypothetical protein